MHSGCNSSKVWMKCVYRHGNKEQCSIYLSMYDDENKIVNFQELHTKGMRQLTPSNVPVLC